MTENIGPPFSCFTKKRVCDVILKNDIPCFHSLMGKDGLFYQSFPLPTFICIPGPGGSNKDVEFIVRCPICDKDYEKSSKIITKKFLKLLNDMPPYESKK